jgi:ribosomal protein L22
VSPDKPQDPQKGRTDEVETPEAAEASAEAAAVEQADTAAKEEKPKPKRTRKKADEPKAAETAAEETEVDKDAAAAEKPAEKPKRTRAKKADAEEAPDQEAPAEEEAPAEKATPARKAEPKAKPERRREAAEPLLVRAQAKARLVCDHIRGKDVQEARAILAFTPRAAAKAWIKLLDSAVANAEHNHELVGEDLRVQAVYADEGPTLKRFRPRAMGRATRIRKRTSHLTIMLAPKDGAKGGR